MNEPTHIDLFSGIGGFALAAGWAGFRTVAFCEIEPYCQAVLKARFGAVMADTDSERRQQKSSRAHGDETAHEGRSKELHHELTSCGQSGSPRIHPDIRRLDGRLYAGASLLTGGFPCQPFSVAGKRAGAADNRFLWPEMLRVVSEARPAWIVGENVAGIINMELDRCLSDLENLGYSVWPLVIPACAVDARHRRDRVWIVANDAQCKWSLRATQESRQGANGNQTGSKVETASLRGCGCGIIANPISTRLEIEQCESGNNGGQQPTAERSGDGWARWLPESNVGRVAHGVPKRVDRLKGLGNAIVPQVAFQILKTIRELIA